jgi:hypothetical protein
MHHRGCFLREKIPDNEDSKTLVTRLLVDPTTEELSKSIPLMIWNNLG